MLRYADLFTDFNGKLICLGLFYAEWLGNCLHFMFIFTKREGNHGDEP